MGLQGIHDVKEMCFIALLVGFSEIAVAKCSNG